MADTGYLNKVLALLAKAESTEFPAEAEALFAKAQELITQHSLDEAVAAAQASTTAEPQVQQNTVVIHAPYARAKAGLLSVIADTNACSVVMVAAPAGGDRVCEMFGHADDIEAVKTMFAALSLHGSRTMGRTPVPSNENARRFRSSFMHSYAYRIGQRMKEARMEATDAYEAASGTSVALVVRERAVAVNRAMARAYPNRRSSRTTVRSQSGMNAGINAANRANLGQTQVQPGRTAIGR